MMSAGRKHGFRAVAVLVGAALSCAAAQAQDAITFSSGEHTLAMSDLLNATLRPPNDVFAPRPPGEGPKDPGTPWCFLTGPCGAARSHSLQISGNFEAAQRFETTSLASSMAGPDCPNPRNLPEKAASDLCDVEKMQRIAACNVAAQKLMDYRVVDLSKPPEGDNYQLTPIKIIERFGGSQTAPVVMKWYSEDVGKYLENCMRPLPELASSIGLSAASAISDRIGTFRKPGNPRGACVATYLDGRFFTARHCLMKTRDTISDSLNGYVFTSQDGRLTYRFSETDRLISTHFYAQQGMDGQFRSAQISEDIVAIKTPDELLPGPGIPIGFLQRGDQILIPGYNANAILPALIAANMEFPPVPVPDVTYYFDDSPICMIVEVNEDRCIRHACQTENQMSGSPIFARRESGVVFVGVHNSGRSSKETSNCWKENVSEFLSNTGAAIAPELLAN